MKLLLTVLPLILGGSFMAYSQVNTLPTSGNVGVRNASPLAPLHINTIRPILFNSNGGYGIYGSEIGFNSKLNTSVVPNKFIKLGGTSQKGGANLAVDYWGNILIQTRFIDSELADTVNYAPQFKFTNNGKLGIGTLSPNTKLEVAGDFSVVGNVGSLIADGSGARLKFTRPSSNYISASDVNGNLSFGSGGIEQRAILKENGNFGIATASPQTKFHVNGNARINQEIQLGNDYGRVYYDASTVGESNRGLVFQEKLSSQRGFHFLNSSGAEVLRITNGGGIGIGTSTIPSDFKLAIAGKTLTEKVIVRKQENWNWPDFVFEENYGLPELSYIKDFVDKNHHLPEMPSAKEVQENGLDLDEMNRLLLKKVEELTLYVIELQEKNDKQDYLIQKILKK